MGPMRGNGAPGSGSPRTILITQGELVDYGGSEMVTLELAEYLSTLGWSVHVLANFVSEPMLKEFRPLDGVTIHTKVDTVEVNDLDLIWVHHQLLPETVVDLADRGVLRAKVVFQHMSAFVPLEFPLFARVEAWLADAILFNSPETQRALESALSGLGVRGQVFGNPAPDTFWSDPVGRPYSAALGRLLIVSNHLPEELLDAVEGLRAQGVEVRAIGRFPGGEPRRTLLDDLEWADAVVSIGKTVQYAIVNGLPAYCYDHFGGSGWLSSDNFEKNADLNFSGRGFESKGASQIVDELVHGYRDAQDFARRAHVEYGPHFLLSYRWQQVMDRLAEQHPARGTLEPSERAIYTAAQNYIWELHRVSRVHWENLVAVSGELAEQLGFVDALRRQDADQRAQIMDLRARLDDLKRSRSWRVGAPLRWLYAKARALGLR
jgi:hypothetical protein